MSELDWLCLSRVTLFVSDDLLRELRRLRDEWLELLDSPYDNPPLQDNELIIKILLDWVDDMQGRLIKLSEAKLAAEHGGRTPYMFDDNGNEYYTTVDGVRHYTRDEG